jgi:hypothetical protein
MKPFNTFVLSVFALALPLALSAQTSNIIGRWQLIKKSNCMEGTFAQSDSVQDLVDDMHSRTSATAQIISFRENSTAEESTRILNSNRSANQKKFFYKFNGDMLLILDKKTQTISDNYMVDKFTADSLILSNSARPCEIKIFSKIKDDQAN